MAANKEVTKVDEDLADILREDEPVGEPAPDVPVYAQRTNLTEEQVNLMLKLGYNLHAITPMTQEFIKKDGYHISLETVLVYHFMR
jgi:hypothetical protein